nr:hypothetical protein [Bradyrhizobium diazoefficiens]
MLTQAVLTMVLLSNAAAISTVPFVAMWAAALPTQSLAPPVA